LSRCEWLLFRRRWQATGRLPKAEMSGFHLKNRVATPPPGLRFPRNVQAAMLVDLVPTNLRRKSQIVHDRTSRASQQTQASRAKHESSSPHGDRHSVIAGGVPSDISTANTRHQNRVPS
jgi:hypothetical protein